MASPQGGAGANDFGERELRNLDFGLQTFYKLKYGSIPPSVGVPRPKQLNANGKSITIKLNSYNIDAYPKSVVYQYDVKVQFADSKKVIDTRGVLKKVWKSNAIREAVGPGFIYDGNKNAWGLKNHASVMTIAVDLSQEAGKVSRPSNTFRVTISPTARVVFDSIDAYLEGRADMDNDAMSAVTFLDHLLREGPSQRMTSIKRSFFEKHNRQPFRMSDGVEAMKGAYAAIKPVYNGDSAPSLAVNVDVANGTFFQNKSVDELLVDFTGARGIKDVHDGIKRKDRRILDAVKKIKLLHVVTRHGQNTAEYVIEGVHNTSARDAKVMCKEGDGEVERTVEQYFQRKHGIRLKFPQLYLLRMKGRPNKPILIPMELCWPETNARFSSKLSDRQTADMIKVAVTPPSRRWNDIQTQVSNLGWRTDVFLRNYGLQISAEPTRVKAIVMQPPTVSFGAGGSAAPGTSGRWDLRNKKFLTPGEALSKWSICIMNGRDSPDSDTTLRFKDNLIRAMQGHGMRIDNKNPRLVSGNIDEPEKAVRDAIMNAGGPNDKIQLCVFILPRKEAASYNALKHFCDIGPRTLKGAKMPGVASQMLQAAQVMKEGNPQYCSNVATKINAKLGGITSTSKGQVQMLPGTMFIGCDVSHGAPGSNVQSIAAMTVSSDRTATKYLACVASNGDRKEMVSVDLINGQLKALCQKWMNELNQGKPPSSIFYMRDGVSEGQYPQVLTEEVRHIEAMIQTLGKGDSKICAMVCSKRHHVRFFPEGQSGADRNGNALPGTLVETGVTDPRNFDFYLCSHAAIKGTARPVHYYMLRNDTSIPPGKLQQMVYEHCYQYSRATTPISLHPAIYYAHQAAARAAAHVPARELAILRDKPVENPSDTPPAPNGICLEKMDAKLCNTMWFI